MPRITFGNKEIVVVFQHGKKPSTYRGNPRRVDKDAQPQETDYTSCLILSGELGCLDEDKIVLGEATVVRFHADLNIRKVARTNALRRAMDVSGLDRDERTAVWKEIRK
mgnify:CR=1 FL=1